MVTTVVFIVLALVLFLLSFTIDKWYNNDNVSTYKFQKWEKVDLPYITVDVGGHPLNAITDSAASVSLVRRESLAGLPYERNGRQVNLVAVTDDTINSETVIIPIVVNGKEIKTDFAIYDGDDIGNFKRFGVNIDILLGVEFFKASNGIINFENQTVTFP